MRVLVSGLALAAALALAGCEGMAPGGYGDLPDDPNIAAAGAAIPQLPPQPGIPPPPSFPRPSTSFPTPSTPGAPAPSPAAKPAPATPPGTGGPLQTSRPPTAPPPASSPAPSSACSAPNIVLRTEASGAVEIKCGRAPMAPPAGLSCKAPEQLTFLTRNGVSNFTCMR